MERLIRETWVLRKKCEEYANLLSQRYGKDDPRVACFNMIFNKTTLTIELLDYYYSVWGRPKANLSQKEINRIRSENAQRCIMVTSALFIGAISVIEFNMKNVIRSYPTHPLTDCIDRREKLLKHFDQTYSKLDAESQNKLRKFKRELKKLPPSDSFWRIIEKSLSLDIVDEKEANIWKFIIELRNCTVHNNAIASRDCQVNIDGRSFQLKAEQMIRDKLDFSIFLTRKVLDCFFSWVQRFDAPQSCECQE